MHCSRPSVFSPKKYRQALWQNFEVPTTDHQTNIPNLLASLIQKYNSIVMSDDDEDTVVGNCLHCNAPPPPRSKSRGGSTSYSNSQPCPSTSTAIVSSTGTTPPACTRVQVSCDDCRSFICDGE